MTRCSCCETMLDWINAEKLKWDSGSGELGELYDAAAVLKGLIAEAEAGQHEQRVAEAKAVLDWEDHWLNSASRPEITGVIAEAYVTAQERSEAP